MGENSAYEYGDINLIKVNTKNISGEKFLELMRVNPYLTGQIKI